jgi:uncharacterized protein (DUF488 family)
MSISNKIYTIGHSTHAISFFIILLQQNDINCLIDVRSTPYSRWQPQFNQQPLAYSLELENIAYFFLGQELGARSQDSDDYLDGKVQYDRLASTEAFLSGIDQVIRESKHSKVALMCAEKDPLECHRTLLVAKALEARAFEIVHILADGGLETNAESMTRLLKLMKMPEQTLFESRADLVEMACKKQESIIAYRNPTEVNAA